MDAREAVIQHYRSRIDALLAGADEDERTRRTIGARRKRASARLLRKIIVSESVDPRPTGLPSGITSEDEDPREGQWER